MTEQDQARPAPPLPEYDNPPVIEVVCGILFEEIESLHAVQLGAFWERLKNEYDHCREVAPLAPMIEVFGEPRQLRMQLTDIPPLARTWLLTPKENGIVQVQKDRLLHNWKKVEPNDAYPRYSRVREMFRDRLESFDAFLAEVGLGPVKPLQYEMTYVNHIPLGDGWNSQAEAGLVFPDFLWRTGKERFLPEPEQITWRTSFVLPGKQGRLHASLRNSQRSDGQAILLFELTARGFPGDASRKAMWNWFDLAHEWIVRGFTDLTGETVRKQVWRQK